MTLRLPAKHLRRILPAAACVLGAHAVLAQVPAKAPDHAAAYYHDGLAHMYEEMAIANGRQDYAAQAVEEYKLALSADPDSRYLQDGLADLYFKIGRIREAVNAAQEQTRKDPSDIAAHTLLGKVYLRSLNDMQGAQASEMLQLAIAEYEKLAQLEPRNVETHLLLGQLYGLNHDSAKAETEFKQAQALDGNSEEAVLNMARLYSERGQTQQAVDALNGVPAGDRSARVYLALGAAYEQMHQPGLAIESYKAALDQDPDNPDNQRALAAALLQDNQLESALPLYQALARIDPSDAETQIKISEIQRRQGHYDEALVTLTRARALSQNTDNLELPFNEAVLYDALGQYGKAVGALQDVLTATAKPDGKYSEPEKSNRAIFLDRLGIVYREQGKTPEAVAAYKQMIALGGNDYLLRGYQGEVDSYRDAHQWKDAVAAAAEASKAMPKDRSVQLMYAFQLADTGEVDRGLALAKAQLNGSSDDRDTHIALANIDLRLHRSADATLHLDQAETLSKTPNEHMYLHLLRATLYDHDKQYDQAEAEYRKALAIDPNNATVLNDLGYMLADRGVRLNEALTMVKRAVELDPQNGSFLDSLGWVYFKLGQYGPAEENLHKAIERTSGDASIHDHLGEVYEKTGRLKLAVAQWERTMTEYAHSLPADTDSADVAKVKHKLDDARTKLARNNSAALKKS